MSFDPPVFVPVLFLQGQDGENPGCRKVPSGLLVLVATRIFYAGFRVLAGQIKVVKEQHADPSYSRRPSKNIPGQVGTQKGGCIYA